MNDDKFITGAWWVGSIIAGILLEAVLLQVAQRCLPGLFQGQQPNPGLRR